MCLPGAHAVPKISPFPRNTQKITISILIRLNVLALRNIGFDTDDIQAQFPERFRLFSDGACS
jgi:hypothetical protein